MAFDSYRLSNSLRTTSSSDDKMLWSSDMEASDSADEYPSSAARRPRRWASLVHPFLSVQRQKRHKGKSAGQAAPPKISQRRRCLRFLCYLFIFYFACIGVVHTFGDVGDALSSIWPDEVQWVIDHWGQGSTHSLAHWPTDASGDVGPVSCHSHNDEWRAVPLFSAIDAGCTSVEADVFVLQDALYVGHSTSALTSERTLKALYLDPLLDLVMKQNAVSDFHPTFGPLNGIFDTAPTQTLVLLIDFKRDGRELWPRLMEQLGPLREKGYLTFFNGSNVVERPITVVASGDAPFDMLIANSTYRDIFYDAPLDQLADLSQKWDNPARVSESEESEEKNRFVYSPRVAGLRPSPSLDGGEEGDGAREIGTSPTDITIPVQTSGPYNVFNSYYGSVSFTKSVGWIWGSRVSESQLQLIRAQIRGAHERGLKVRYWGLPYWPAGLRNHVWHILMREGVDMLSVDDLIGATRRDWRKSKGFI